MIGLGKGSGNLMVDVHASNAKLRERALHIVMTAADCSRSEAEAALSESGGKAKTAIVMVLLGLSAKEAEARLAKAGGYIARVNGIATKGQK